MMAALNGFIEGIGLLGPGLPDWAAGLAVLKGGQPYTPQKTVLPPPQLLPPAERRRSCMIVKLALAIGAQALAAAQREARGVPTVFASSGGEGDNCHALCETLASSDRGVSPTRFHNSVQNVTAGYWGIATGAMSNATVVCAFDGSFSAGMLEALTQCVAEDTPTLLMAYDTSYPEPLNGVRPIADAMGIALMLAPSAGAHTVAKITARVSNSDVTPLSDPQLERLRTSIPAARGLPLLHALAMGGAQQAVLEYLEGATLAVEVTPC